jgi:hypothetical protein
MGPAVQLDPPDGVLAAAKAAPVLPTVFVPFQQQLQVEQQQQQLQLHAGPTLLQHRLPEPVAWPILPQQQEVQQMPVVWPMPPQQIMPPLQMFHHEVQQMPGRVQMPAGLPSMAPEEWSEAGLWSGGV